MDLILGGEKQELTFKTKNASTPTAIAMRVMRRPNIAITWRPMA